ncbi:MAG TPA: ATP-binding protein [Mycobacteriales bacterium]|nr:ATP-binding protein [Mycobacteriales bacterium]
MSVGARLSRLPLRVRLVSGFSAAMFVVLLAAGAFVYWRVAYDLDRGLNTDLSDAEQTLRPLIDVNGTINNRDAAGAAGVAWQVLDSSDHVLDHDGAAASTAMVSPTELAAAATSAQTVDHGDFLTGSKAPYRLRIVKTRLNPTHFLVIAVRRDHRDEALRELLAQLAIAGFGALVITAFVGDRLARAALRPVERYRRRATQIAGGALDLRLDVPPNRDDEVTRLGHTFNDMLATLERALERERQFVNEASHELRTPITVLTSRVQLARRRSRTISQHEAVLDELQVDLGRLAELAEQLLQLGAAGAGDLDATADLRAAVDRSVKLARHTGARAKVSVSGPAGVVPVTVGEVGADRIVGNLLDNARIHGAPPIQLIVDRPSREWSRLVVTDAGPGMAPALLANATQRFTRSDEARARPGAGLGLSLVDGLVSRAGGELRLCFGDSHVSHGREVAIDCSHGPEMTVTVLLPAPATQPPS